MRGLGPGGVPGQDQDRDGGSIGADAFAQSDAADGAEAQVGDHDVEAGLRQQRQGLLLAGAPFDREAPGGQRDLGQRAHVRVVVHEEHPVPGHIHT